MAVHLTSDVKQKYNLIIGECDWTGDDFATNYFVNIFTIMLTVPLPECIGIVWSHSCRLQSKY